MRSLLRSSLALSLATLASTALLGCSSSPRAQGAEAFDDTSSVQIGRATLYLPGIEGPSNVAFQVVNGMAVMEGDVLLGPADQLMGRYGFSPSIGQNAMGAVAVKDRGYLWANAEIPYEMDGTITQEKAGQINWAIQEATSGGLKLRPKQFGDTDYIVFHDTGESWNCSSYIGRIGGAQTVNVAGCGGGSIVHEIMHAAGFHHEQSRGDRDQYITISWNDIIDSERTHFETRGASAQDIGPYDYSSIMHYGRMAFSKTGNPTIIPKAPEANIGQREGLSQLDRQAIAQLYGGGAGPAGGIIPGFPSIPGLNIPGFNTEPVQPGGAQGTQPGQTWQTPFGPVPVPGGQFPFPGGQAPAQGGQQPAQGGQFPVPGGQLPTIPGIFQ